MVEAGANEISEAEILDALDIAHSEIKKLCALQRELAAEGRQGEDRRSTAPEVDEELLARVRASHGAALDEATQVEDKLERQDATQGGRGGGPRAVRPGRARGRRRGAAAGGQGAPRGGAARVRQAREVDHPRAHRGPQEAPRRARRGRDPRHHDRSRA